MGRVLRMTKATSMASGVTMLSVAPLFVFHVAAPVFAPMVGGYWAGSNLELSEGEALILGLIIALLVGLPLPIIQQGLGYFHYLSPITIDFFGVCLAIYAGGLVGIFAWWGGNSSRTDVAL